jgi:hypothetical protein
LEPVHGELAGSDLEEWYAALGRPTRLDSDGRLWLPTGEQFDVVEVPEQAGRNAARRLLEYRQAAVSPGPVVLTAPGRCGFLVAPGAREDLPELLEWLDWGGIELGIRTFGPGERIPAPGPAAWLHDPAAPAPEVIALLATIAEACWLEGLGRCAPAGPAAPIKLIAPRTELGNEPGDKPRSEPAGAPAIETPAVENPAVEPRGIETRNTPRTVPVIGSRVEIGAESALGPGGQLKA